MLLSSWIRSLFQSAGPRRGVRPRGARPSLEPLEERVVLYSVTGNAWPHPERVTLSFMPDGTQLSSAFGAPITSNLFSAFNARFGLAATWENQILRAAQVWSQQTNVNFSVVSDSGAPSGSGSYEQGDPGFGDIRIGGYAFGNATLGSAYQPPPANNYSLAGDIALNTGQSFNINSTYDLYSVALHEIGHALGLDHSSSGNNAAMYPSYTGVRNALSADDMAGIRNIYSRNCARSWDAYEANNQAQSFATAANLNAQINPFGLTALVPNLQIRSTTDAEYFTSTAPAGTNGTFTVSVQCAGLSLFSPGVTVYAADQHTVLGQASAAGQYGTTVSVKLGGVVAGQQFYVKVQGADSSVFSTGAYALALNFGSGATPVAPVANTQVLNGTPLSGSGGVADGSANDDHYLNNVPTISGVTPDTGTSANDGLTNARNIQLNGLAPSDVTVRVFLLGTGSCGATGTRTLLGSVVAKDNKWTFDYSGTTLADGAYTFTANAVDGLGNVSADANPFTVVVDTVAPAVPILQGVTPDTGSSAADGVTSANQPTVYGTAAPNCTVTVYRNGANPASVSSDSRGNWSYKPGGGLGDGSYAFTVTVTDAAGNVSALSASLAVTVDTQAPNAPVITGISPDSGIAGDAITNAQRVQFLGNSEAYSTVAVSVNGQSVGSVLADGGGNWVFNYRGVTLAPGTYTLIASATDAAGNVSQAGHPLTMVITLTPPAPPALLSISPDTGSSNTDQITSSRAFSLSGTAVANGTVNVFFNGTPVGSATAAGDGKWTFAYTGAPLADGNYAVTASATDTVGNVSARSAPLAVTVDTKIGTPQCTAISPDTGLKNNDEVTRSGSLFLYGTSDPNNTVRVFLGGSAVGSTVADGNGNWTFNFTGKTLADGTYTFTAQSSDVAGNVSTLSGGLTVVVDSVARVAVIAGVTKTVDASNVATLNVSGTAEPQSQVQVFLNRTVLATVNADDKGNWTYRYEPASLPNGTYNFATIDTDLAGNVSAPSATYKLVLGVGGLNASAPKLLITSVLGTSGNGTPIAVSKPTLTGTTQAGYLVTIVNGNAVLGTAVANDKGQWTFTCPTLAKGTHNVSVSVSDPLGETGLLTSPLTFQV